MHDYYNVEIEMYSDLEWGLNIVHLSNDGSSGCKYPYKDKDELKQCIHDYIDDMIDACYTDENN